MRERIEKRQTHKETRDFFDTHISLLNRSKDCVQFKRGLSMFFFGLILALTIIVEVNVRRRCFAIIDLGNEGNIYNALN